MTENKRIAYKIKTTAPKCYLVKPNIGICNVGEPTQVQITNHAIQDGECSNHTTSDKFLILTTEMNTHSQVNAEDLGKYFSTVNPTQLTQHRLEVMYKDFSKPTYPDRTQSAVYPNNINAPQKDSKVSNGPPERGSQERMFSTVSPDKEKDNDNLVKKDNQIKALENRLQDEQKKSK